MKVCVVYRPNSEHARVVEDFIHDYQRRYDHRLEILNLETREGASMATLYDVVRYPAILAVADDGHMLQLWEGEQLPLMNEVAAYASQ